jgi:segregation and condensation protein B
MKEMTLTAHIESILFVKTEGVSVSFLAKTLEKKEDEIERALAELGKRLDETGSGLQLVRSGSQVLLSTHAVLSGFMAEIFSEEDKGELSPSSLQTLSIILFKGEATRGEITYMRGVDSRTSLRNLLIRGLIEKTGRDSFRPTADVLRFLGVSSVEDLPRFKDVKEALEKEVKQKDGE